MCSLDSKTGNIVFNFGSTANFVHETTHGGQFENGELAFDKISGNSQAQDVFDEVAAYSAQFAYDPNSISRVTSSSIANSFDAITPAWVQGIINPRNGEKNYAPGGRANTGITPVNINTNRDGLIKAYPHQAEGLGKLSAETTLKSSPSIYYKK